MSEEELSEGFVESISEILRRKMAEDINSNPRTREELEEAYGKVWSTDELVKEFQVLGFMAPLVVVRRRSDDLAGSLMSSTRHGFISITDPT